MSKGVAERAIGVLTNAMRATVGDSGLPDIQRAEAFNTATYVHNRTPTRALGGCTLFEARYNAGPGALTRIRGRWRSGGGWMTGRMGVTTARNLNSLGQLTLKPLRTFESLYIMKSVCVPGTS